MRDYGPPPENQTELVIPGVNDEASKAWEEARRWTCLHFSEWCYYKEHADAHRDRNGKASPNACLNAMRERFKVELPNAWAPALARLAMQECPHLDFRIAKSKFDPCAEVVL